MKLFPLGGAGLGCRLCLWQGRAARRASGGSGGILGCSVPAGISDPVGSRVPLGDACSEPFSIPVAAGSDGREHL